MRRVLVTGGASGIGRATCDVLRERGWETIAADLNPGTEGRALDVTEPEGWDRVWDEAGQVDALVNCAGIRTRRHFSTSSQTISIARSRCMFAAPTSACGPPHVDGRVRAPVVRS